MMELSAYVLSALLGGEFVLYRGRGDGLAPILLVAAAEEYPSPGSIQRLEHQYALRDDLHANWAARPVGLIRHEAQPMLVLEDPGGEPLERLLGRPLEIAPLLRIAIRLAAAIGQVHARGLIHKDLKPANILVDMASGGVWLTGFGIASRLPRERQALAPPEVIAGTLAYMAPEQTGRMNRSIDSRSDLYALGVILYEMLTGVLPFTASDPMEWIHCHIARQPVSPAERGSAVPAQMSAIVMKLLAKTAEARYQTAAGVEADLRRCLTTWEAHGRIDPFPLGGQDASDRLLLPEKLYGREKEIGMLLAAFDRVVADGRPELVLVSGYSGVGKSSVVNELHKALVPTRGLFAAGKFDQYKRDIPYATLAQAFQGIVRQLLSTDAAELNRWRNALLEALGPNGQLMINMIPELALVIGKQPPVAELPARDAQKRFLLVFRRFLCAFAKPEHPLALFLDDLQWLDAATLDFLEHLATHSESRHLLLIGAYRANEVGPSHPLLGTLESIRQLGAQVQEIVLAPLGLDEVGHLVADALHCAPEHVQPLAQLVQEKTVGNPFFAIQFFLTLAEEGMLAFDPITQTWHWDVGRIRAKSFTDNVVDLMVEKLKRFSFATQEALKKLACLGNVVDTTTLALVHGTTENALHAGLSEAVRGGLVFCRESAYGFLHDRVQQAAYSLIPDDQRADLHLRIGRVLLASMTADDLAEYLFDVANQFNRGVSRLIDPVEKVHVATIDLRAGRKAKASAAYASAREYFATGIALLDERDWESQHELTFSLSLEGAECELLCGNLKKAAQQIVELLQRAASNVEFADASCLKVNLHVLTGEHPLAIDSALACLRRFGIDLPAHPTLDQVRAEYQTVRQTLGRQPIESLIDLPPMTDPKISAAMQVLSVLAGPATFTDFRLFCLLACRMVNVSIQHGMSGASAYAYACLGSVLGANFHRYREGYCLARLACDLVEKHGFTAYDTKVYHAMGLAAFWAEPITSVIELRRATTRRATERGDLTFACYGMHQTITYLLIRNDPLDAIWREAEMALDFARTAKFRDVVDLILSQQRFIASMQGRDATCSTFNGERFDEAAFEAQLTAARTPTVICINWIFKLKARYLSGDYAEAQAAADKAKTLLGTSAVQLQLLDYLYYGALAVAAVFETASAAQQSEWRELLILHCEQLGEWAESNPPTFSDKHALVLAEIARLDGREGDAMRLYEQAIQSARGHGFVQNEGLAHEVAARFYAARGFETIAHAYLRNARYCYLRWGAGGKVRQLDQTYPRLREQAALIVSTATNGAPVEQLDIGAVTKGSQAISCEVVLDRLIETLMTIVLEHAGAERGLLILLRDDASRIVAEATTGRDTVIVRLLGTPATPSELPDSVLQYVIRTQDSVILDDASAQNTFSADPYIRRKHARSVLCLPLVKQAKLIGTLYLENNLASHVFTPDRISVLKLLSSQAAISIENARLYAELITENRDRRKAEDDLRRSEESLAQAQQISNTGSWRWNIGTGEVSWSAQHFRTLGVDPAATEPSYAAFMDRLHPEDRSSFEQVLQKAVRERSRFQYEYRIIQPDGAVRYLQSVGQPDSTESGSLEFVGTVMDITERRHAEEALRNAQAELVRVARLTTMGELVASIAHEINQPLAAVAASGNACLRWLNRDQPNLDAARESVSRIVRDAHRAGDVIRSVRALTKKSGPQLTELDINGAIQEVLALAQTELQRHGVVLHTDLSANVPPVFGDRIQLQQVLLNLITNATDAMSTVTDHTRELTVSSALTEHDGLLVTISDTGSGLDPTIAQQIFEPFFTTKSEGLGMGLSICRSIIAAHGGELWVSPNVPYGTVFRFTVPGVPST
jgi:predicted ATPase/signal transduction histidine kinase